MADDRAKAAAATLQALEETEKNGKLVGYQKKTDKLDETDNMAKTATPSGNDGVHGGVWPTPSQIVGKHRSGAAYHPDETKGNSGGKSSASSIRSSTNSGTERKTDGGPDAEDAVSEGEDSKDSLDDDDIRAAIDAASHTTPGLKMRFLAAFSCLAKQ